MNKKSIRKMIIDKNIKNSNRKKEKSHLTLKHYNNLYKNDSIKKKI